MQRAEQDAERAQRARVEARRRIKRQEERTRQGKGPDTPVLPKHRSEPPQCVECRHKRCGDVAWGAGLPTDEEKAQAVHDVAREHSAPLCQPAGQSRQALHRSSSFLPQFFPSTRSKPPQQFDRPVSYWPAPHPVFPWNAQ